MLPLLVSLLVVLASLPIMRRLLHGLRQWRMLRAIPSPPVASYLLGHVPAFLSDQAPITLARWTAQCGPVFRIRFLASWGLIITDPALVRAVLQNSKTYIPKDRRLYQAIEAASLPQMPNVLTSSDGDYWRSVRAAWMKCFTSPNLKRVLPTVISLTERVVQQLQQQQRQQQEAAAGGSGAGTVEVNLVECTDRITLDVIGHVSYGRDFGAVEQRRSRYLSLVTGMLELMHERMAPPLVRLLTGSRRRSKARAMLLAEWDAANTAEVLRALAEPPGEHTIAGQLLLVKDPVTGQPLAMEQLKSEMVIAALAGFETTSNALSWTIASLACHPAALQRLEQELDAAELLATPARPQPRGFTWQLLGKLPFLNAVIRESLRLFSPASNGTFRLTNQDVKLADGLVVPKGTPVGVPFFAFGHNPAVYGCGVEQFRPERWLPPQGSNKVSSSAPAAGDAPISSSSSSNSEQAAGSGQASTPGKPPQQLQDPWSFSIGPRDCAGQALARMELQAVLVVLLGRMHVELASEVGGWEGLLARRMYHSTLQIRGGLPVLLRSRV